uniref:L-threonylcarbamoyladenylate synthase n=1 Tax=Candidatus Kentrum sp. SD TaxID=2126332 RepID=A0A450YF85_9GAMM|nr:MAG: L-threonylcarbamoyladenylate synthase [Candidatus Kentron sp. SD]VFK45740.1 MAG: L-threonylcarbamoyladenylate synthase [Candidatus Kentron sp. SD]
MQSDDEIRKIVACLENSGVVLMPTDTVYGLAVLPARARAVGRVYALKQRPGGMNLPIMVDSAEKLPALGLAINEAARRLLDSPLVPGALTLALGFRERPIPGWLEGREEVAIRIPDDRRLLDVLGQTGPLLVTSANRHGDATPGTLADALAQLDGAVDLAVEGGRLSRAPSTLVNCRRDPPVIEREGAISRETIMEYLR